MRVLMIPVLLAILLLTLPVMAQNAEEKGLQIATEADRQDEGFGDFRADLRMTLKNKHGDESIRNIRNQTLEVKNDGDKTLAIFESPRDVKGTGFLSFTHKKGADDQWLYLPALKRVKRINSANKSGSFMGSEFAYEDITSQEVEKYAYLWLRDEDYNGRPAFVIERDPVDPKSGYTRQVVWIDQAEYTIQKIDFYDRKNALLKTQTVSGYQQYLGRYWRPDRMEMINHQTGKSTRLDWKNYRFQTGLKDRDFSKSSLERVR